MRFRHFTVFLQIRWQFLFSGFRPFILEWRRSHVFIFWKRTIIDMSAIKWTELFWDMVFSDLSDLWFSVCLFFQQAASPCQWPILSQAACSISVGPRRDHSDVLGQQATPFDLTEIHACFWNPRVFRIPALFFVARQPARQASVICVSNSESLSSTVGIMPSSSGKVPVRPARHPQNCPPVPISNLLRKLSLSKVTIFVEMLVHSFQVELSSSKINDSIIHALSMASSGWLFQFRWRRPPWPNTAKQRVWIRLLLWIIFVRMGVGFCGLLPWHPWRRVVTVQHDR